MPRPAPPMYAKVARKVPAKAILMPPSVELSPESSQVLEALEALEAPPPPAPPEPPVVLPPDPPEAPEVSSGDEESDEGDEEEDEEIEDLPDEETDPDGPVEWSEDMTRKDLYHIAKRAGLDVVSRDSKAKILKQLRKLGK